MSLRGKDFRCELDADLHEQLRLMAERLARCGIARHGAENGGKGGK